MTLRLFGRGCSMGIVRYKNIQKVQIGGFDFCRGLDLIFGDQVSIILRQKLNSIETKRSGGRPRKKINPVKLFLDLCLIY